MPKPETGHARPARTGVIRDPRFDTADIHGRKRHPSNGPAIRRSGLFARSIILLPLAGFVAIVIPPAALSQTAAYSPACAAAFRPTPAQITVTPSYGTIAIDNTRTIPEITALFAENRQGTHTDLNARGLNQATLEVQLSIAMTIARLAQHGYDCAWPLRIGLAIGYPQFQIFIARKYPEGTCQYRAILDHENGHAAINRDILQEAQPYLQASLTQAARAEFPIAIPSNLDPRAAALAIFERYLAPTVKWIDQQQNARNAQHDSPASYQRTQNSCRTW